MQQSTVLRKFPYRPSGRIAITLFISDHRTGSQVCRRLHCVRGPQAQQRGQQHDQVGIGFRQLLKELWLLQADQPPVQQCTAKQQQRGWNQQLAAAGQQQFSDEPALT